MLRRRMPTGPVTWAATPSPARGIAIRPLRATPRVRFVYGPLLKAASTTRHPLDRPGLTFSRNSRHREMFEANPRKRAQQRHLPRPFASPREYYLSLPATAEISRYVRNTVTRYRPPGPGPGSDQPAVSAVDPVSPYAEARMRRALGLDGQSSAPRSTPARTADTGVTPGRHRHRFVSDGDVPVVMVQSRPDQQTSSRLDSGAAALQSEKDARQRAERALATAQASVRELQARLAHTQTTLAHVSLARDEAVATLRQLQEQVAASRAAPPAAAEPSPPAVRRRGRPPKVRAEKPAPKPRERTQKPVKWWVKGWRSTLAE